MKGEWRIVGKEVEKRWELKNWNLLISQAGKIRGSHRVVFASMVKLGDLPHGYTFEGVVQTGGKRGALPFVEKIHNWNRSILVLSWLHMQKIQVLSVSGISR